MTLKKFSFLFVVLAGLFFIGVSGQSPSKPHISDQQEKELEKHQDSLSRYAYDIINAQETNQRFRADSFFIRMLVRSLKVQNSFFFPFDSLQTISKLYAPDSSFRIFTWQIKKRCISFFFQRGAIQMRTEDGFPQTLSLA